MLYIPVEPGITKAYASHKHTTQEWLTVQVWSVGQNKKWQIVYDPPKHTGHVYGAGHYTPRTTGYCEARRGPDWSPK